MQMERDGSRKSVTEQRRLNVRIAHAEQRIGCMERALLRSDTAWNQTWHLPTAPQPPTGAELIRMAAEAMGVAPQYRMLRRPVVRIVGWFNPVVGEVYEMLYQNDSPYLFDSTKYARAFGYAGTPYAEGVQATAAWYRNQSQTP